MINNTIDLIPEMITIRECSSRTGVSYDWIRKLCLQGRIVHIRAGNKYLINFGKFVDYLNNGDLTKGENNNDDTIY